MAYARSFRNDVVDIENSCRALADITNKPRVTLENCLHDYGNVVFFSDEEESVEKLP